MKDTTRRGRLSKGGGIGSHAEENKMEFDLEGIRVESISRFLEEIQKYNKKDENNKNYQQLYYIKLTRFLSKN